ncbi:MAG TPA: hypothetical protein VIK68_03315 [Sphingomicrobium sp.]
MGGLLLGEYRLYCLDQNRHIAHGEWFAADDDDHAIALVTAKRLGIHCELWSGNRMVAKIPAHVTAP